MFGIDGAPQSLADVSVHASNCTLQSNLPAQPHHFSAQSTHSLAATHPARYSKYNSTSI